MSGSAWAALPIANGATAASPSAVRRVIRDIVSSRAAGFAANIVDLSLARKLETANATAVAPKRSRYRRRPPTGLAVSGRNVILLHCWLCRGRNDASSWRGGASLIRDCTIIIAALGDPAAHDCRFFNRADL